MSNNITVTFVGTTSGGGPTDTRNCSSLVVDPLGNGSLWMVDCAEGTVRQFESQPHRPGHSRLRVSQVSKIFITHMHADHTMGTLTFLRNVLGIPKPKVPGITPVPPNRFSPRVEIFGPRGIRRMLRMLWHMTHTHSEHAYIVHELLFPGEQPSVAAELQEQEDGANENDIRRESECVGQDIWCDESGFWRGIVNHSPSWGNHQWGLIVDAGPIEHRDPCIGYVIREIPRGPPLARYSAVPRKLVILGDTHDPSPIIPLIHDDPPFAAALPNVDPHGSGVPVRVPVTLLVHEATDCFLPPHVDPQGRTGRNRTKEGVDAKTVARGHSTPAMAGAFARRIGAERLVLNHIGARFPAPDPNQQHGARAGFRLQCMRDIERQAAEAWNSKRRVQPQAAWDYLSITLPPNQSREWMGESSTSRVEQAFGSEGDILVEVLQEQYEVSAQEAGGSRSGGGRSEDVLIDEASITHSAPQVSNPQGNGHGGRKRKTTDPDSRVDPQPGSGDARRDYSTNSGGGGYRRRNEDKRRRNGRGRPRGGSRGGLR